ncbi:hypothetical protein A9308_08965 [Moraxella atlantae]|uniref:Initiator Rep protein WH1 domain-containing protein n=1 Tax=Faucicola atlantae TaxID=34059 RepID=A0A1B8QAI9_9GAMM|nr:replication initiation protein [Moraxella atlantae]OBX76256.1 hypothetical protein A9308_08965 [Moraxella atlantae]
MKCSNQELITMSNDIARASYRLTVNEIRLLLVAMAQMPKDDVTPIDPNRPYYVTKDDFVKLGVAPNNVAHEIRAACSGLMDRKLVVDTPVGDYEFHWISNVLHFKTEKFEKLKQKYPNSKYDEEFIESLRFHNLLDSLKFITNSDDNIVARIVFSKDIIKYISQLKAAFTQLHLEEFKGFSSFYSFRIYIMMKQFASSGYVIMKLDDFRKSLDLEDNYKQMTDLRKRVLDVAISDINENSPYSAEYDLTDKDGRSGRGIKLTHLHIKFELKAKALKDKKKNDNQRDPNTIDWVNGATDNELKKAPSWQTKGLSDAQIRKIGVNKQEFIDANSGKISPNDHRSYDEIFEDWKPKLKDPSTVNQFDKVQELLDRKRVA